VAASARARTSFAARVRAKGASAPRAAAATTSSSRSEGDHGLDGVGHRLGARSARPASAGERRASCRRSRGLPPTKRRRARAERGRAREVPVVVGLFLGAERVGAAGVFVQWRVSWVTEAPETSSSAWRSASVFDRPHEGAERVQGSSPRSACRARPSQPGEPRRWRRCGSSPSSMRPSEAPVATSMPRSSLT